MVDLAVHSLLRMMSNTRGKDTKPEMMLRRALHVRGFRFGLHRKWLPGRPDLVFPKHRAAVFVHGCFWHRHPGCSKVTTPATRVEFWQNKFTKNPARDQRNIYQLQEAGWRVLVVLECGLANSSIGSTVDRVSDWLVGNEIS